MARRICKARNGFLDIALLICLTIHPLASNAFNPGTPLEGVDPVRDKAVNSVFDRSLKTAYKEDGRVEAYTGEIGDDKYGEYSSNGIPSGCYKKESRGPFLLDGNYNGAYGDSYLCYDGHPGIDFKASYQWVVAVDDGVVTQVVNWRSDEPDTSCNCLGNYVEITHDNGYVSRYGHLLGGAGVLVSQGQIVYKGERIATSGNSGLSFGPHLHFQLKAPDGRFQDPYDFWSPPKASSKFSIGALLEVIVEAAPWLHVRDVPSGSSVGKQLPGARGSVVGGPTYAGGHWWWQLDFESGVDGWVAEKFLQKASPVAAGPTTQRVSVASDGTQGNNGSGGEPSISADGRFVAFESSASNLVAGDTNGTSDLFVHDRQTGLTERVSVATDGIQSNSPSGWPSISADGRFVAFASRATNLVMGGTNGKWHVFVHDRQTGLTELVSVASDGTQGDSDSDYPSISADGRSVAFTSHATNLVAGRNFGGVFVHDRQTGLTELVSVASDGTEPNGQQNGWPSISADGHFVAFASAASNLVAGDTNGTYDVFVHDRQTGLTERVSVASDGTQGDMGSAIPSISSDGRFVAFQSTASNLIAGDTNGTNDVFVHDRQTGLTDRVSVAKNVYEYVDYLSISADGRFVAFAHYNGFGDPIGRATSEVFVHDRQTGLTELVSVANDGTQGNAKSHEPSISADGRFVAFWSYATNLVADDTNGTYDVFVRDRGEIP